MDPRERWESDETATRAFLRGHQAKIWTTLPGIIQSFNPETMTAAVQPAIQARVAAQDGTVTNPAMPLCVDVPVQFPSGGGATLTFPVTQGDECLLHFSARSIDAWFQSGGVQPQVEHRMHDLSDGFAALGYRSQPRALSNVSTSTTQLRSDDGETYVELDHAGKVVNIVAPSGLKITAPALMVTGDVVAGAGGAGSVSLLNHKTSMVAMGTADSGPPVPGT